MKKIRAFTSRQIIKTPALFVLALTLLAGFWLSTSSADTNAPNQCTVCHKLTSTQTYPCNSLDYRRHKDHGDPDGACSSSAL